MICATICSSRGYAYFGLEFSFQCWCGNTLDPKAVPAGPSNCNYACCADGSVACGGCWFISVYASNATNNSGNIPIMPLTIAVATTRRNKIALGTGIGIGVPEVILSTVLVMMKFSKRRHNPEQNPFQQWSETSSIAASTPSQSAQSE